MYVEYFHNPLLNDGLLYSSLAESLDDDPRCGWPSTAINEDSVKTAFLHTDMNVTIAHVERENVLDMKPFKLLFMLI